MATRDAEPVFVDTNVLVYAHVCGSVGRSCANIGRQRSQETIGVSEENWLYVAHYQGPAQHEGRRAGASQTPSEKEGKK
jgi:hypothetical protein